MWLHPEWNRQTMLDFSAVSKACNNVMLLQSVSQAEPDFQYRLRTGRSTLNLDENLGISVKGLNYRLR